jgi:hypothetical protein
MLENRTIAVERQSPIPAARVEPPSKRRARLTNNPFSGRTSGNTARGRRIADLMRSYLRAMGEPTDAVSQADALAAAELKVAAEDARARLLAGTGDVDQTVRLENLAARSAKKLGIKPGKPAAPSLAEHLAKRAAERAGARSGEPA